MSDKPPAPFSINVSALKSRPKDASPAVMQSVDRAGEQHGFVPREATGKRGRPPSPRIGQVHAKVLPHVAEEIAAEARRRGTQQGILIEEAWALYLAHKSGK
jgi:hypothetical protein